MSATCIKTRHSGAVSPADEMRAVRHRLGGLIWVGASEVFGMASGFAATLFVARALAPEGFAKVEISTGLAAWMLVLVRGGMDQIALREAARRPVLIARWTALLIPLRAAAVLIGMLVSMLLALVIGGNHPGLILAACLVLVPSALAADLAPRSLGRLRPIAIAQVLRGLTLAVAAIMLVRDDRALVLAVLCPVLGEITASLYLAFWFCRHIGPARLRVSGRACRVLIRRSIVASVTRCSRVGIFSADLISLGWLPTNDAGAYAACRRVGFGLLGLGMIVPAHTAPGIAAKWHPSRGDVARRMAEIVVLIGLVIIPPTLGLILFGDRLIAGLFGEGYRPQGIWFACLVLRIPLLVLTSQWIATLIACRQDDHAWKLTRLQIGGVALSLLIGRLFPSRVTIALGFLAVEFVTFVVGWRMLQRTGIAPLLYGELQSSYHGRGRFGRRSRSVRDESCPITR